MGILASALVFALVLGFMVFIHELGHFLVAKRAGIRVEEFGIGFPPKLIGWRRGETEYTINALPLGGFVRMTGEDDPTDARSFAAAPKRWRIATLLAGSFMNLLAAGLIFTVAYATGVPTATEYRIAIGGVSPDSPAQVAGLRAGDIIVSANGQDVKTPDEFRAISQASLGKPLQIGVLRDDQPLTLTLTPRTDPPPGQGAIGIQLSLQPMKIEDRAYPLPEAIRRGVSYLGAIVVATFEIPAQAIRGLVPADVARPVGPVGIFQIGAESTKRAEATGSLYPILNYAGLLGAGLGVANLLPIPGLDGGRLLFILIEALRGRRVDPRREGIFHLAGFVFLISMVLLISYFDIMHPITGDLGTP